MTERFIKKLIARMLRPLEQRLALMVGRGIITLIDDTTKLPTAQIEVYDGEPLSGVERFEQYGVISRPLKGAEHVTLFMGGSRTHGMIIASSDRRYRMKPLPDGVSGLYTDEGDYILLDRGRIIKVVAGTQLDVTAPEVVVHAETKVTLDTPECEATGNMTIGGNLTCGGTAHADGNISSGGDVSDSNGSMQEMRDTYNSHTHAGVQSGGGSTAPPSSSMS